MMYVERGWSAFLVLLGCCFCRRSAWFWTLFWNWTVLRGLALLCSSPQSLSSSQSTVRYSTVVHWTLQQSYYSYNRVLRNRCPVRTVGNDFVHVLARSICLIRLCENLGGVSFLVEVLQITFCAIVRHYFTFVKRWRQNRKTRKRGNDGRKATGKIVMTSRRQMTHTESDILHIVHYCTSQHPCEVDDTANKPGSLLSKVFTSSPLPPFLNNATLFYDTRWRLWSWTRRIRI